MLREEIEHPAKLGKGLGLLPRRQHQRRRVAKGLGQRGSLRPGQVGVRHHGDLPPCRPRGLHVAPDTAIQVGAEENRITALT